jgi:hypothetical protein
MSAPSTLGAVVETDIVAAPAGSAPAKRDPSTMPMVRRGRGRRFEIPPLA